MKTALLILAVAVYVAFTLAAAWNLVAPGEWCWLDRREAVAALGVAALVTLFYLLCKQP